MVEEDILLGLKYVSSAFLVRPRASYVTFSGSARRFSEGNDVSSENSNPLSGDPIDTCTVTVLHVKEGYPGHQGYARKVRIQHWNLQTMHLT